MSSARIFLNYRRADSAGWTRQLHGDLGERFGAERVFRDVTIAPGVDFVDHIERVMDVCEVCIVVIGKRWLASPAADGRRRLDDPEDLVRVEIEHALARSDVCVIPVLVDGAQMPADDDLPSGLRPLARRNACELSDTRWDYDVDVLCKGLRRVLGESTIDQGRRLAESPDQPHRRAAHTEREPEQFPATARSGPVPAALTLGAALVAGLLAALLSESLARRGEPGWGRLAGYAVERGTIWALVGAGAVAAAAAAFRGDRVPLGPALVGAGAGWLGGAAGGAGYMAIKYFGAITEQDAHWLLLLCAIGAPAIVLATVLARYAGASVVECVLSALAGAAIAALLHGGNRTMLLTLHVMLVIGATAAVLASPSHHAGARLRAATSRGAAPS